MKMSAELWTFLGIVVPVVIGALVGITKDGQKTRKVMGVQTDEIRDGSRQNALIGMLRTVEDHATALHLQTLSDLASLHATKWTSDRGTEKERKEAVYRANNNLINVKAVTKVIFKQVRTAINKVYKKELDAEGVTRLVEDLEEDLNKLELELEIANTSKE